MKKIIASFAFLLLLTIHVNAQKALPILNMESGDRTVEQGNCYAFGSVSYSNLEFRINGFWSGRTNQLTNPAITACWIKTPWILPTSGNITLSARLENNSGTSRGIVITYIPYDANAVSATKEGAGTSFYTYNFPVPLEIGIKNISVPMPAAIANSNVPHKILISFVGVGGNSRAFTDDIFVPGTYYSDPSNACLPMTNKSDKDNDGVEDAADAYPEDAERAFNTDLVNEATLMFEDLWPNTGDYDFNDLVTKYSAVAVTNANDKVVEVLLNVELRAIGASFNNGLAFQFDDLDPKLITGVKGNLVEKVEWLKLNDNGTEANQKYANVTVFGEALKLLPSPGGSGVNVNPANGYVEPQTVKVSISFNADKENGVSVKELKLNPYIIVNQDRGVEVHLANYQPSSLASEKFFGTGKDKTSLEKGNYYKTENNLPFAIQLDKSVPHMQEKIDILEGYPKFADWAKSGGKEFQDWYSNPEYRNEKVLFFMKGDK
jgi:LruC domain-containing protein